MKCALEKVRDTDRIDRYFSLGMAWRNPIVSVGDPSGMYLVHVIHQSTVHTHTKCRIFNILPGVLCPVLILVFIVQPMVEATECFG